MKKILVFATFTSLLGNGPRGKKNEKPIDSAYCSLIIIAHFKI